MNAMSPEPFPANKKSTQISKCRLDEVSEYSRMGLPKHFQEIPSQIHVLKGGSRGGLLAYIYIYTYASTPQHHDPDFWVVPVRISAVDSFYGLQNGNGNGLGTRRLSMLQTLKEFLAEPNFRKESLPKPDSLKESLP